MVRDEQWWCEACECAERITARQLGVPPAIVYKAPIEEVRAAMARKMAPSASSKQKQLTQ